jgi:hypothetical protein
MPSPPPIGRFRVHPGRFAGRLIRLVRWRGRARKMLESYAPIGRMNLWITVWGESCPPPWRGILS